jgi:hypothetical protein
MDEKGRFETQVSMINKSIKPLFFRGNKKVLEWKYIAVAIFIF